MRSQKIVYVLRSEADPSRWYTGLTHDIHTRLAAHNRGDSRHTATGRPWRPEVAISFATADAAQAFERYLKSGLMMSSTWTS